MKTARKQDRSPTRPFTNLSSQKELSDSNPPQFKIVAGPNGAGKSTFAEALLTIPYINGDEIKRIAKLNGIQLDSFGLRIHIKELVNDYIAKRQSFALESNLVSPSLAK